MSSRALSRTPQMSRDVPADARSLCDKAGVFAKSSLFACTTVVSTLQNILCIFFFFIFFNLFRMERKKGGGWFWNRRSEVCHRVVAGQVSSFDWRSLVQNLFAFLCWFAPETGFSPSARHICLARSCFLSTIIPRFSWVRDARFRPTNYSTSPRPLRWTGAPRLLDNSTGLPTVPQDEGKID